MISQQGAGVGAEEHEKPAAGTAGAEHAVHSLEYKNTDAQYAGQRKKLAPHHVEDLALSGISEEAAIRNGLWSATDEEVAEILGRSDVGAGLAFPFSGIDGEQLQDNGGRPRVRVRPDDPARGKYLTRRGAGQQIFLPSGVVDLARKTGTLYLTEGEKKGIGATEKGIPCIGLVGNWGWKIAGSDTLLKELENLLQAHNIKEITLIWDSDASTNFSFATSTIRFAKALRGVGVSLRVAVLPGNGTSKVGLDDFLMSHSVDDLYEILEGSAEITKKLTQTDLAKRWLRGFVETVKTVEDEEEKRRFVRSGLEKLQKAPREVRDAAHILLGEVTDVHIEHVVAEIEDGSGSRGGSRDLPIVLVQHACEDVVVTPLDFAKAFFKAVPEGVYYVYGGSLATIHNREKVSLVTAHVLMGMASEFARFAKVISRRPELRLAYVSRITKDDACVTLALPDLAEFVRPLASVIRSPILVGKPGQLKPCAPGYNEENGGVFVTGTAPIPQVSLENARETLLELFKDFKFSCEADKSRVLSMLLTPALRLAGLVNGHVPVTIVEADQHQTGKTYLITVTAAIYGEVPRMVAQRRGGVGSLDESLSSALLEGRPLINLDNLRGRIDSPALEALLTAEQAPVRVPHRGEVMVRARNFVLTATSNAVQLTPDLAARAIFVRLLHPGKGHKFSTWPGDVDLLTYVWRNQPFLLGCVFSLIQEWDRQGRPRVEVTKHSFRDWAGTTAWIVEELMGLPPMLDDHEEIQNRTASPDRVWLRQIGIIIAKGLPEVKVSASQIAERSRDHEVPVPGVTDPTDTASAAKRIGQIMGAVFQDADSIIIDNVRITRFVTRDDKAHELKTYAFTPRQDNPTDPTSPEAPEALHETCRDRGNDADRAGTENGENGIRSSASPQAPEAFPYNIIEEEKLNSLCCNDKGSHYIYVHESLRGLRASGQAMFSDVTPPSPQIWSGQRLGSRTIAIDTETTVIQGHEVPTLVLASASDGDAAFVISAEALPAFLRRHRRCRWVFHNASFDFWVLQEALADHPRLQMLLWRKARDGELGDTMLLDQLLRIARDGTAHVRDLGTVAAEVAGIQLNKDDPFRLRYAEILGKPLDEVDPGFLSYAAADAFATARAHSALEDSGWDLWGDNSLHFYPECIDSFGDFTEAIQIRGAIALSDIGRRGIRVDPEQLATIRKSLSEKISTCVDRIEAAGAGAIFKRGGDGAVLYTKTGMPSISEKTLQEQLRAALARCPNRPIPPQNGKGLSRSVSAWQPYRDDEFVDAWLSMRELGKSLSFCGIGDTAVEGRVHPRYTVCVGTGRTSCSSPNIQQLPRTGGFREAFIPADGYEFMTIDYSYIELVTLAAICEMRFGQSALADTIRAGIDPHANTAALILEMGLGDFLALKEADPSRFKELRQRAKALNFGVPGGLGHERLCDYARDTYGVDITPEEAEQWRTRLIREVYPEIGLYLDAGQGLGRFCRVLGCTESELHEAMGTSMEDTWLPICIEKVVSGNATKRDGTPYDAGFVQRIWGGLAAATDDPALADSFRARDTSVAALFAHVATTPTGRVRGNLRYTEACNAPFQGLAADGAKEALFLLVKAGFRVVAFVHDEFLVEIPSGCENAVAEVERLVKQGMQSVIGGTIPVSTESSVANRWSK